MAKRKSHDSKPRVTIRYTGCAERGEDSFRIERGSDAFWLLPHDYHPSRRELTAAGAAELTRMGAEVTEVRP